MSQFSKVLSGSDGTPARNRPCFCRSGAVGRHSGVGHRCGPSDYIRRGVARLSRVMSSSSFSESCRRCSAVTILPNVPQFRVGPLKLQVEKAIGPLHEDAKLCRLD